MSHKPCKTAEKRTPTHSKTMGVSVAKQQLDKTMILKLYVPTAAAETPDIGDKTLMDVLKERACRHYGGFTTYGGKGGWADGDGNVITEKVVILEIAIGENPDVAPETFGEVNARWILRATDESAVMFTVDNKKHMEFNK